MDTIIQIALFAAVVYAFVAIHDTRSQIKVLKESLESLHGKVGTLLMRTGGVE